MGKFLSLYKGPSPPLHAAHVSVERFILRRPLPPVAGSPNLRVLSACPTPGGTSLHPCFVNLFAAIDRSNLLRVSLVHEVAFDHMLWVRTPGMSLNLTKAVDSLLPSP